MLVFIVPLVSPQVANSWERVTQLFERCIKSICNQTSLNFRVVVVCNQKPQIRFDHPYIKYVEIDFPPPSTLTIKAKTFDRGLKVMTGLTWAQRLKPSYAMIVDADDCVNKHLAKFVEQNQQSDGWFINKGYIYKDGSKQLYLERNFHKICGTCSLIKYGLYDSFRDLEGKDSDFVLKCYGGHKYIVDNLINNGNLVKPLPFIGAVYIVENGENYYNQSFQKFVPKNHINRLKSLRHYRALTDSIRNEFNLYDVK